MGKQGPSRNRVGSKKPACGRGTPLPRAFTKVLNRRKMGRQPDCTASGEDRADMTGRERFVSLVRVATVWHKTSSVVYDLIQACPP